MYYIKPGKDRRKICIVVWAVIIIICITAAVINLIMTHMIHDTVLSLSKNFTSIALNEAVLSVLEDSGYEYTDFIELSIDEEGSVRSVSAKSEAVNRFRSELGSKVAEMLDDKELTEFSIPFGTLTDIGILYGHGPDMNIRLRFYGDIETDINSSFVSAGINQTKHRITCTVSANVTVITPSFTENTSVSCEYLIAETVIIGDIPGSYTNVNGDDSGIIGQIFDYAEVG